DLSPFAFRLSTPSSSPLTSPLITHNSQLSTIRPAVLLFGEAQSRIIISCSPKNFASIRDIANKNKVPLFKLGEVGGDSLIISSNGKKLIVIKVNELKEVWQSSLPPRNKPEIATLSFGKLAMTKRRKF
ncbi:MAG: hypothetical protein U9R03_01620, partial [Candidatus Aerophobetes bacterium]|nr:hypothetical protein [Candidatus Aerophobetes bacterium]